MKRQGFKRPERLRPVDAPIDELDEDAVRLLESDPDVSSDLRRMELEAGSQVYASRRTLF